MVGQMTKTAAAAAQARHWSGAVDSVAWWVTKQMSSNGL
ncbi:hypothetical protein SynWH8103_00471 [Synechococcus sp. WH 8103]|nr:hypothetical protein SynWH8103_00471 [Synechococcus sp. WH 8103]